MIGVLGMRAKGKAFVFMTWTRERIGIPFLSLGRVIVQIQLQRLQTFDDQQIQTLTEALWSDFRQCPLQFVQLMKNIPINFRSISSQYSINILESKQ